MVEQLAGTKLGSCEHVQVGLTCSSLHVFWFYTGLGQPTECTGIGSMVVQGFLPLTALPLFLPLQSPRSLLTAHLNTLSGRIYQISFATSQMKLFLLLTLLFFSHRFMSSVLFGWCGSVRKCVHIHRPCTWQPTVQEGSNIIVTVKWINERWAELQLMAFSP